MDDAREKLRQHFLSLPAAQQVHGWDAMWAKQITPWDNHEPHPALVDALATKRYLTETPFEEVDGEKVRKRVLVPGCGAGYDVQLFARYGFDAYGLDGSPIAIEKARQFAGDATTEQTYPVQDAQAGRGEARFVLADFFEDGFLAHTQPSGSSSQSSTFDIIYDYTFLCALPPPMRPKWAARMSQLLAPDGILICTEFPLGKNPRLGGPPFGLTHPLYEQLLHKPGHQVDYDADGNMTDRSDVEKTDDGLEVVETWVPDKTFESQKGAVRMSVWKHQKS